MADAAPDHGPVPEPGEALVAVGGRPVADVEADVARHLRHSSVDGLRWKVAEALTLRTADLPPRFHGDALEIVTEDASGRRRAWSLPWADPATLAWPGLPGPSTRASPPRCGRPPSTSSCRTRDGRW